MRRLIALTLTLACTALACSSSGPDVASAAPEPSVLSTDAEVEPAPEPTPTVATQPTAPDTAAVGPKPEATASAADPAAPEAGGPADPGVSGRPERAGSVDVPTVITSWQSAGLDDHVGRGLQHVTDVMIAADGRIVVGFYADTGASVAIAQRAAPEELRWDVQALEGVNQVRDIVEVDGALLLTGTASRGTSIVWRWDGSSWTGVGAPALPSPDATNGWDLELLADGSVLLATDSLANDPATTNPGVFRSDDGGRSWELVGSFPGLGVLALTTSADGAILAATEESAEHDDPAVAGTAAIHRSVDGGRTWSGPIELPGANRVYTLRTLADGRIWAGTGITGQILESIDGGLGWRTLEHVPTSAKVVGEGDDNEEVTLEATRVYSILELADGRVMVGTGNKAGNVFITADGGRSWQATPDTGRNNVVWGLAQDDEERLWVGTGSSVGDLLTAAL